MVISKSDSPRRKLQTGDLRIKQVHRSLTTIPGSGKCDTEIKMCFEIVKDTSLRINKILRDRKSL